MQHCKFLICLATIVTNYSLVVDFVEYRHSVEPLDGIIIFQTKKFSSDCIERELQHQLHLPLVIVKNVATSNLQNFMSIRSIALVFMDKLDKPRTWVLVPESLPTHSLIPMIFISQEMPTMNALLKFFEYFRQQNMLNTVVLFRVNDTMMVRTSVPYPKVQIITVEPRDFSCYVWPKYRNVFGYNFRFSLFDDPPVAYKYVTTDNRTELRGLSKHLLSVFVKRVNATFTIVRYPMNETMKRSIDMTANLVLRTDLMHHTMEPSYPVFLTKACLLLPVESGIPLSWYLFYAFDIFTWQMLGFTFLVIVLLKIVIHHNYSYSCDLAQHVFFVLQLFLAHSIHLPGIRSVIKCIFLLYFGGLFVIIVSVYVGSLTSLFSTGVRMPAVRTPEDFLKTDFMIMSTDFDIQLYFDSKLLPTSLVPRIYDIGSGTTAIDRSNANTSFAYIMPIYKWVWYNKQQRHLEQPVFRIADGNLCTPRMGHFFALRKRFPFKDLLNLLSLELQQFGFIDHWLAEVPPAGKHQLNSETGFIEVPLSLAHFTFGFYILSVGWVLAFLTLVGELIIPRRHGIFCSRAIMRLENSLGRK